MKKSILFFLAAMILLGYTLEQTYGLMPDDASKLFDEAKINFSKGEYKEAITKYDEILESFPDNVSTLKIKGIALSNLGQHEQSLKQFYRIAQLSPNDVTALTGLGLGFGYLGEYQESRKYFEKALEIDPNNAVAQNYKDFVDKVITKYPYKITAKPKELENVGPTRIPPWVKSVAKWWSEGNIEDSEFVGSIGFLISKGIMQVPSVEPATTEQQKIPLWVKQTTGWWSEDKIGDLDFVSGIHFLMENGIIRVDIVKSLEDTKKENDQKFRAFENYLRQISKNVVDEKRYIEFPNPSFDVIKKFLRDYVKWNFEQEAKSAAGHFPDPTYEIINGTVLIHYKIFVNEQPTGLPLDHVSTLNDSLGFWEKQELSINGQKGKVKLDYTENKSEANIWVTWVVRDLGQGVLGHAHLGKGIVEVALGDYSCDGIFQLYDVKTVERIMTHELGHSIGLQHTSDPNNIMYTSMKPRYAYCLLN